jgi:hypothetical protein
VKLTFRPQDGDEQSWTFDLGRFRVSERMDIERYSGMAWGTFKQALINERTAALKALLFVLIRREHPKYRFDDVDFCDDEIVTEVTLDDLHKGRQQVQENDSLSAADKAEMLEAIDQMIADKKTIDGEVVVDEQPDSEPVAEGKVPPKTSSKRSRSTSARSSTSRSLTSGR